VNKQHLKDFTVKTIMAQQANKEIKSYS
jgi:predicted ribonuclease toxin of YeeF-YezG toxin-antitoxin module